MSEHRLTILRCPDKRLSSQQQGIHRDTVALLDSNNNVCSHMNRPIVNKPETAGKTGWAPVLQTTGVRPSCLHRAAVVTQSPKEQSQHIAFGTHCRYSRTRRLALLPFTWEDFPLQLHMQGALV